VSKSGRILWSDLPTHPPAGSEPAGGYQLLIHGAQLLTVPGTGPQRSAVQQEIGLLEDGAVAVAEGCIVAVGPTAELRQRFSARETIDATGKVVLPGFVDAHTHAIFAGERAGEFEQRLAGASYLEIMAAGGGIMSTVRATRAASLPQLITESRPRLDAMLAHGTTTAEVKTGYGLNTADELEMLAAICHLDAEHPLDLIPTFLGAHAVPEEYKGRADEYVALVVEEMLPRVAGDEVRGTRNASSLFPHNNSSLIPHISSLIPHPSSLFCDVFCEEGAFSLAQSRRILEAAKRLGLGLKIHADEFTALGGAALAAELGATSADHLAVTPEGDLRQLAAAGVVAVLLPGTTFGLGKGDYADARRMIELGVPVALGSDLNPGTCWCESMPFIIALACRYLRLTPAEAIVAATRNAAYATGVGDRVGSLEVGKQADIIILDLPDYRHLAYRFGTNPVQTVIKAGRVVVRH
jgi:imidazolonepropionase